MIVAGSRLILFLASLLARLPPLPHSFAAYRTILIRSTHRSTHWRQQISYNGVTAQFCWRSLLNYLTVCNGVALLVGARLRAMGVARRWCAKNSIAGKPAPTGCGAFCRSPLAGDGIAGEGGDHDG
jgi:hypothetical protein